MESKSQREERYANEFKKYLNIVKELGFKVYIIDSKEYNYGWITDGINICYCELGNYGEGFHLSTENKTGHNFGMCPNDKLLYDVKKGNILYAFNYYPNWAGGYDCSNITKYKNWEEFISKYWNKDNIIEY